MRPLLLTLALLAGCGDRPHGLLREPDEYTGCSSDEQWLTLDDQEPLAVVSDSSAAQITSPAAGATLPAASRPMFTWKRAASDPGAPVGDVPHDGPACNNCCPQWNTGAITTLHLPPISGNVYDLQFSFDGDVQYRVVTTIQAWSPDDATWALFRGKSVSLKIWRMTVLRNDVPQGGGPFVATTPFLFVVTP